jgi:hypothetical protein
VITSQGGTLGSVAPRAAVLTITAVNTTAAGNFIVWGGQGTPPTASVLNWAAGQVIADTVPVPWGGETGGALDFAVRYNGPSGQADVVVDVIGYFTENQATALDCVTTTTNSAPIAQNGLAAVNSPTCPGSYTLASGSCYLGGDGWINESVLAGLIWQCRGHAASDAPGTIFSQAVCCRVPGQ